MELSLGAQPSFQSIDVTTLVKKCYKNINISTIIIHHRSKIFLRQSQWVLLGPSVIIKIYFIRRSTGLLVNCPAFGNSFIQLCFLSLPLFRSLSLGQEYFSAYYFILFNLDGWVINIMSMFFKEKEG